MITQTALNVILMYFQQAKKTAFHYAVDYQNTKVVQILSGLGANVNEVSMKNNHIPECLICI